ncbi:MAG: hypothetical protein AWU55_2946 [Halomonadaceae bacterium T82-2]|nr:MAG: hypothetical protein AWU55_2946 [Halomonadaceae bacterium T82-2]
MAPGSLIRPVRLALGLALWLVALSALAAAEPHPFSATYRLHVAGWPDVTIHHQLSRDGGQWESAMNAQIAVAEGNERGRFRVTDDGLDALFYKSGYRLFGLGKNYRLDGHDLAALPDRQTALVALARQAATTSCNGADAAPCTLRYRDYDGAPVTLAYRILDRDDVTVEGHHYPSLNILTWHPDKPERQLRLRLTPALPGLLLGGDYRRDGDLRSTLELADLNRNPGADQSR